MNKVALKVALLASVLAPLSAFAQLTNTTGILTNARDLISGVIIPIAFTLALLYFFWGVAKYIRSEGVGKEEGRKVMVWGVVALFVMSSVWGLVQFIRDEFSIQDNGNIDIPTINGTGGGGDLNV